MLIEDPIDPDTLSDAEIEQLGLREPLNPDMLSEEQREFLKTVGDMFRVH